MPVKPLWTACAFTLCSVPAVAFAIPYTADLSELSGSGVSGTANLDLDQDLAQLTVDIEATGLEPGQPHAQHIHGRFDDGNPIDSTSPTQAQDADGDGFVELGEGLVTYGPIIVPLTSPPGGDPANFPTAEDGTISFSQVYDLSDSATYAEDFTEDDLLPLDLREIVLHGLTVEEGAGLVNGEPTGGEVDGTGGYKGVLPVASGEITAVTAAEVPEPATWALLLAGVGATLLGGLWRRPKGFRPQTG